MIQDILPHIFSNEYRPIAPDVGDIVFAFSQDRVLLKENSSDQGEAVCPTAGICPGEDLIFLFRIDEVRYYLYGGVEELTIPGYHYESTRTFRRLQPKVLCFAGMTAWHLYTWYRDHRFCGRCGKATIPGQKERVLVCPSCGNRIYPVIAPAVIVGVISGSRLLLTRYKGRPYGGYALIAGFCEIGETVEETVRREVMEEVGLHVKNLRYYGSQPWGFANNLLMGFYCELDGEDQVTLDGEELAVAEWIPREEIGRENRDLSLTADMIMEFKNRGRRVLLPRDAADSGMLPERKHTIGKRGEAAVLIPLIPDGDDYRILFEKRALDLVVQPGEVCFPGGGIEERESPVEAALRETAEELLVEKDQIRLMTALEPVMGPSGASIWPFAAILEDYHDTWSEDEVDSVFTVSLRELSETEPEVYETLLSTVPGEDFPYELIPGGRDYPWRKKKNPVYFYRNAPEVIWGLTARILHDFINQMKKEEL